MLDYGRTNVSEGIGINKTNGSHEYIIYHYRYYFTINFRFQSKVWDGCHKLLQKAVGFNEEVTIFSVKGNSYELIFWV